MSTKRETTQDTAFSYDPVSMGLAQSGWAALKPLLQSYMSPNITASPFFKLALQQGTQQADLLGQTGVSTFLNNLVAGGGGAQALAPFQQAMLSRLGRQTSGLRANAFWNAYGQGLAGQQNAMGIAAGFRPLQTGGSAKGTEKTSGLGTWLPQTIGAGMSLVGSLFGMPGLGGGIPGAGAANTGSPFMSAFNPIINQSPYLSPPNPFGNSGGSGTPWLVS